MKPAWDFRPLGAICRFIDYRGRTPIKTNSGLRLITAKNVKMGYLDVEPREYMDPSAYSSWMTRGIPRKGDVLITTEAPLANIAQLDSDDQVAFAQRIIVLQLATGTLDPTFLKYQLLSDVVQRRIHAKGTGATVKGIKSSLLKTISIGYPSVIEQRRIVAILDKAFEGIARAKANAEKSLENARAVFESRLQAILSCKKWKKLKLGDLCRKVEYGSSAKSKPTGKVPVLRMGNIQDGRLDWTDLVYTDDKAEISKYQLQLDDVLFNRTNSPELVGKTAVYRGERPAVFAGYLIKIHRREELLDANYLNYFLNSQIAKDYGKTVVSSSVHQANINGTKLMEYPIPSPSLAEQRAIVAELDSLRAETERLSNIYERKIAALDELKKSLLHQAFAGQL